MPLSTFLRQLGLGKTIRARRGQLERDAIYQLSKVGNNLNQLARGANTAGQVVAQELLEEALEELRALLAKARRIHPGGGWEGRRGSPPWCSRRRRRT